MNLRNNEKLFRSTTRVVRSAWTAFVFGGLFLLASAGWAQGFDSGSDGSDGALSFSCPGGSETIEWDPDSDGLDVDADRVFHFTTITVGSNCVVLLTTAKLGQTPITWLATGAIEINGSVRLDGNAGHGVSPGTLRSPALPGPGGFPGGLGQVNGIGAWTDGFGPGKGTTVCTGSGAGAGYLVEGNENACGGDSPGGDSYGNQFLLPLIGGSGGSGDSAGGGGGAGAGAILVASSESIAINSGGELRADGGDGTNGGGGGSGGAIRLLAPVLSGSGSIRVEGGTGGYCCSIGGGSRGRVRIEVLDHQFTGFATSGTLYVTLPPNPVFVGNLSIPSLRVTTFSWTDPSAVPFSTAVSETPSGGFTPADVTIDTLDPVTIDLESENVPAGTTVMVEVHSESVDTQTFQSSPLAGASDPRTASVTAPIGPGFSSVTLRANFMGP